MLFNSLEFALFLPIVFLIYWFILNKRIRLQNIFLLISSYVFYGWWDWRFLGLIIFSSSVDYLIGISLGKYDAPGVRKKLLLTSVLLNVGLLGFFKYFNFFIESFNESFSFFGYGFSIQTLSIVLPVGISFYTFQTLSYTIDVYKRKLNPTNDVVSFFTYVSFFPQLVAGPIERATNLLPQFFVERKFNYELAVSGLKLILWGLFKKTVIADNCAVYANIIFDNTAEYSGSTIFMGVILFAFQIYGDFSGYSDIAIGVSRLLGFNLMRNFAFPYFSRDIAEFWRRWHISLSTWFRDYLYIPLGGSRGGLWQKIRNTFIIFVVSGFWHGANWTFIFWGFLNAIYFLPLLLLSRNRVNTNLVAENRLFPNLLEFGQMFSTFMIVNLAWIFFRADSMAHVWEIFGKLASPSILAVPEVLPMKAIVLIILFVGLEWFQRRKEVVLEFSPKVPRLVRYAIYYTIIACIILIRGRQQEFIYFQF